MAQAQAPERPALRFAPGEVPDGVWLVGTLHGLREGKEFNGRVPMDVGLLIGGGIVAVQYRDAQAANAAVGGTAKGERVALRVENRHGAKNGQPWQFYAEPFDGASADRGGWE